MEESCFNIVHPSETFRETLIWLADVTNLLQTNGRMLSLGYTMQWQHVYLFGFEYVFQKVIKIPFMKVIWLPYWDTEASKIFRQWHFNLFSFIPGIIGPLEGRNFLSKLCKSNKCIHLALSLGWKSSYPTHLYYLTMCDMMACMNIQVNLT